MLEIIRFPFEWNILEFFDKIKNGFFDIFFFLISEFGASFALMFFMTIIYWCINKQIGKKIALISFTSICLNGIVKGLFSAKRPFEYQEKEYLRKLKDSKLSDSATGSSFPSGHSQNAGALYFSIHHNTKRKFAKIFCVLMIILVPISRLYLGVHFPGDVVVGLFLGLLAAIVLNKITEKFPNKTNLIFLIILIVQIPFMFIQSLEKDFFKGYGLLLGVYVGSIVENKFINFENHHDLKRNILRYIIGILIMGVSYLMIHFINHTNFVLNNQFVLKSMAVITHAFLAFMGLAVVPFIFKKIKFLR